MPKAPNLCGTCTACCTIMGINDLVPVKPRDEQCPNCLEGKGCGIYKTRPESCRTYKCIWLASQDKPGYELPEVMRPDRCGALLNESAEGNAIVCEVHPDTPNSWAEGDLMWFLFNMRKQIQIIISKGPEKFLLTENHGLRKLVPISDDGNVTRFILEGS